MPSRSIQLIPGTQNQPNGYKPWTHEIKMLIFDWPYIFTLDQWRNIQNRQCWKNWWLEAGYWSWKFIFLKLMFQFFLIWFAGIFWISKKSKSLWTSFATSELDSWSTIFPKLCSSEVKERNVVNIFVNLNVLKGFCTYRVPNSKVANPAPNLDIIRLNGPLSNFKEFSDAYKCPIGSKMNPVEKCSIWWLKNQFLEKQLSLM